MKNKPEDDSPEFIAIVLVCLLIIAIWFLA